MSNRELEREIRMLKGARDTVAILHGCKVEHPIQIQNARAYGVYGEAADIIFEAFGDPSELMPISKS